MAKPQPTTNTALQDCRTNANRAGPIVFAAISIIAVFAIAAIAWDATDQTGDSVLAHSLRIAVGLLAMSLGIPLIIVLLTLVVVGARGAIAAIRNEFFHE
jgi:hypothetical protein